MCGVLRFHGITTEEINKCFQVTGLFPVNWAFADRFKTTDVSISIKYDFEKLDKTDSFKVSTRQGDLIRPSDKSASAPARFFKIDI